MTQLAFSPLHSELPSDGERSLIRVFIGPGHDDEVIEGFEGAESLGKIYFRTGVACIELGDKSEARKLLRVAALYRPNDAIVGKALASVALQLG